MLITHYSSIISRKKWSIISLFLRNKKVEMSNVKKKKKKVVHVKRNQCVCLVFFSFLFLHFVAFLLFYIVTNQTILSHFECLYLLHVSSIASNYVMGMNIKACFFMTTFLPSVDSCISSFTFSSFFHWNIACFKLQCLFL